MTVFVKLSITVGIPKYQTRRHLRQKSFVPTITEFAMLVAKHKRSKKIYINESNTTNLTKICTELESQDLREFFFYFFQGNVVFQVGGWGR